MKYIRCNLSYTELDGTTRKLAVINAVESRGMDKSALNEIPVLLNALSYKTTVVKNEDSGFPLKLPFILK